MNIFLSAIKAFLFCCTLLSVFSCEKDTIDISDPIQALNSISTNWGSSAADIRKYMNGYTPVKEDDQIIIYQGKNGENYMSYKFVNNKLTASLLMIRNTNSDRVFDNYLQSYQYVGNINNDMIYQSQGKNSLAITNSAFDDGEYSKIGFTPLVSDDYEKAEPYRVTTGNNIMKEPTKVTLSGSISGVEKATEVGFLLSLLPDIDEANSRVTKLTSVAGNFEAELIGIADQETYYYQAYAIIDEIPYYGEVRSFETPALTYTINGKEFQVIKVEGGPYGTFSILQTEISVSDKVTFAGIDLGITIDNDKEDGNITLYESKKFIGNLLTLTGLAWRYPTSEEWKFAASGGLNSNNYVYSGSDNIDDVAWYEGNCTGAQEYGLKQANELSIFDMSGNYAELTNDVPIKSLETNTYLTGDYYNWGDIQAYGGSWNDKDSKCKVSNHQSAQGSLGKYMLDGQKFAFRFVYSHHINAYRNY